jgi:DNA ligase-1
MNEVIFPQLYELSTTGNIKTWSIKVVDNGTTSDIITTFGLLNGKMQSTSDTIREGKNIGKANETTVYEQAQAEAKGKWEKKKKKGYITDLQGAKAGEVDEIITGGIEPMLAHSYSKSGDKISYPAYTQPKLDGIRCVAIKKGDEVSLWTRTRKPIKSCPHIVQAIAQHFKDQDITLDGELYNHDLKSSFETIVHAVKRDQATEQSKLIQYHIYDVVSDHTFDKRSQSIGELPNPLIPVLTQEVKDEAEMINNFQSYLSLGYEGLMIRTQKSLYENKRSYHLQKVKEFDDAEFLIIGVKEGRGKLQGTLGTFTCTTIDDNIFDVKMTGDQEENAKYLTQPELWQGKYLTVKFQGMTEKSSVPRFPVGLRIRVEE